MEEPVIENQDIISRLNVCTVHIVERIFGYLDYKSLKNAENVSTEWREILKNERIWKALMKWKIAVDPVWRTIFNQVKQSGIVAHGAAGDDLYMTRGTCVQIGNLYQQFISLMSSSVSLLSSSVKLISKILDMLRLVGFGVPDNHDISDDSDVD